MFLKEHASFLMYSNKADKINGRLLRNKGNKINDGAIYVTKMTSF